MLRLFARRLGQSPDKWVAMSHLQRINYALTEPEPVKCSEIAFYRGLGFKALGKEHLSDAIHAFETALQLGSQSKSTVEAEIATCYRLLEDKNQNASYEWLKKAILDAASAASLDKVKEIIRADGSDQASQKHHSYGI